MAMAMQHRRNSAGVGDRRSRIKRERMKVRTKTPAILMNNIVMAGRPSVPANLVLGDGSLLTLQRERTYLSSGAIYRVAIFFVQKRVYVYTKGEIHSESEILKERMHCLLSPDCFVLHGSAVAQAIHIISVNLLA